MKISSHSGLSIPGLVVSLLVAAPALSADLPVVGTRLTITSSAATGKQSLVSVQKGTTIQFGPASASSELSARFEAYYVGSATNRAILAMPAPFSRVDGAIAQFKNKLAPAGNSPVKVATIKRGVSANVTGRSAGGLDLSLPPGPGGVITVLTIDNAGDGSTHRLCSLYSVASGSRITHRSIGGKSRLTLSKGVPTACPSCGDGVRNGTETGVDCGGGTCAACGIGQACDTGSDCASGMCNAGICGGPACSDGIRNGLETDVDCGGGACPDCGTGGGCAVNTDCQSGLCTAGVCQASSCGDGIQDGLETDVDCGGGACPGCGTGDSCVTGTDCQSGSCLAGSCQAATCGDGIRNGLETDVDCGGGACPACVPFTVTIDTPANGAFSTASSVAVTGHTTGVGPAGAVLLINGLPVALAPNGTFTSSVTLSPSAVYNPIAARLVRNFDGRTAYDRVVAIRGASIADGAPSPNGVAMRITDRGFDAVEPVATTLVEIDPSTLVPAGTKVMEDYCYASLGSLCLGTVDVAISGAPPPQVGPLAIAIDSVTNAIEGDISIEDLRVTVDLDSSSGFPIHCELHIAVGLTQILGDYDLSPLASHPTRVDVSQVGQASVIASDSSSTTDCTGLFGAITESLIGSLIGDVGALFAGGMQDFLNTPDGAGNTPIAGAIETALAGVDIAGPVGSGLGIDLYAPFTSIVEDPVGITFAADVTATSVAPDPNAPNLSASYHVDEAFPTFAADTPFQHLPYGIGLGISTSGFNQLLRAQIEGGLLRSTLTEIDLGSGPLQLTAGLLSLLLPPFAQIPPAEPIGIRISPTLAPILTGNDGPAGELGELRIAQMLVEFVQDEGQPGETVRLVLAVDARIGLNLAFQPSGIGFALSTPNASDITVSLLDNPLGVSEATLLGFLPSVMTSFLPDLASALESFPLPQFLGLSLSGVEVSRAGQYYSIFADLTPACVDGSTCPSGVCSNGACQAASCTDGTENGAETDLDCGGGSCPGCATGQGCFLPSDCAVGGCSGGTCQPACAVGTECPSGVCIGGFCRVANCADGVQNGAETGIDCGGSSEYCVRCVDGAGCGTGSDCASGVCSAGTCQAPSCSDGIRNGTETDVDCGGGACAGCGLQKLCNAGTDCASTTCGLTGRCTCGNRLFTFTVNSNNGGLVDSAEWPGGTTAQTASPGCNVTINRPNNNIDLVCTLGSPFSVNSFAGFSQCFGTGGEDGDGCQPNGCPPLGIGSCCGGRPSCSAALNGSGSARYFVQCLE